MVQYEIERKRKMADEMKQLMKTHAEWCNEVQKGMGIRVEEKVAEIVSRANNSENISSLKERILLSAAKSFERERFLREQEIGRQYLSCDELAADTVMMFVVDGSDFSIGIAFALETVSPKYTYRYAYCMCTPEDVKAKKWSDRIARGILGYRLVSSMLDPSYRNTIEYDEKMNSCTLLRAVFYGLVSQALRDGDLPRFFKKRVQGHDFFNAWGGAGANYRRIRTGRRGLSE
jgi:hypothetical protein